MNKMKTQLISTKFIVSHFSLFPTSQAAMWEKRCHLLPPQVVSEY